MLKVLIIDRCEYCDGEAYLYAGEYKDGDVERPVYQACQACKGAGERKNAIPLKELAGISRIQNLTTTSTGITSEI